jgi:protein-disulfide isomerase
VTRFVNRSHHGRFVAFASPVALNYNRRVRTSPNGSTIASLTLAAAAVFFMAGASCKKESKAQNDTGAISAADNAAKPTTPAVDPSKPVDTTPVPGVDVSKLDEKQQKLFFALVDSFSSPCGKAHSLRTSVKDDASCTQATWAAKYLASMIEDEISEDDIRALWEAKYKGKAEKRSFDLSDTPHVGSTNAPVVIVEYFDYGCPACQAVKPVLDQVEKENAATTVVYYKMFPLTDKHPNSMSAAQAAIAAYRQGKFDEMHTALFEHAPEHKRADVMKYARDLGLDMAKFEQDYAAAEPKIRADMKEGDGNGVEGTPTIFFQGRLYEGPGHPKYFGYWIQEELAVNRPAAGPVQ